MSVQASTTPGDIPADEHELNAKRQREAAALRHDHRAWIVVWLAPHAEFRAYRRLPGARRDTALSAPSASEMKAKITQTEAGSQLSGQADHG
jgi:hypothetical protein